MNTRYRFVTALYMGLAASTQGTSISGSHFTAQLPAGFVDFPQGRNSPDIICSFAKGDLTDAEPDIVVQIEKLPGVIGREAMKADRIAANVDASLFEERWKSFKVQGFRIRETFGSVTAITRNVQVPLKPQAIQVRVVGEESRDQELVAIMRQILSTLDGETNWLTGQERATRLLEGGGRLLLFVVLLGAGLVALCRRMFRRKAKPA